MGNTSVSSTPPLGSPWLVMVDLIPCGTISQDVLARCRNGFEGRWGSERSAWLFNTIERRFVIVGG